MYFGVLIYLSCYLPGLSQVTDHLKAFSKDTNVRVVPIVGGMSTEKQSRLLKGKPEIVVGTPGRLWELMSGGEKHLVEVSKTTYDVHYNSK